MAMTSGFREKGFANLFPTRTGGDGSPEGSLSLHPSNTFPLFCRCMPTLSGVNGKYSLPRYI